MRLTGQTSCRKTYNVLTELLNPDHSFTDTVTFTTESLCFRPSWHDPKPSECWKLQQV